MSDKVQCAMGARTPKEMLARIMEIGSEHGTVGSIQLSCSPQSPGQTFCIIDLKDGNAGAAARALGGTAFSANTVACFLITTEAFTCAHWQDGTPTRNCFDCTLRPPLPAKAAGI